MDQEAYRVFYIVIFAWFIAGFAVVTMSMLYGKIKDGKRSDQHGS